MELIIALPNTVIVFVNCVKLSIFVPHLNHTISTYYLIYKPAVYCSTLHSTRMYFSIEDISKNLMLGCCRSLPGVQSFCEVYLHLQWMVHYILVHFILHQTVHYADTLCKFHVGQAELVLLPVEVS